MNTFYSSIYDGTFGTLLRTQLKQRHQICKIYPNYILPANLHEYDLFIIDMTYEVTKFYEANNVVHKNKGKQDLAFLCSYPKSIFDERAYVSKLIFSDQIWQEGKKVYIVFASQSEIIEYEIADFSTNNAHIVETYAIDNFDFLNDQVFKSNKEGKEIKVLESEFKQVLTKHISGAKYHVVFNLPVLGDHTPLIENNVGDVIGYLYKFGSSHLFVLPDLLHKENFLEDFLNQSLPSFLPSFFPENTEAHWINSDDFTLPGVLKLQNDKIQILKEAEKKIKIIDGEIHKKMIEFQFLHQLIRSSSDELVKAVEKFFNFIGFNEVINADEIEGTVLKQEDLQINDKGEIILIEVKGINGTSTDSDCSQISKVRYRKMKELNRTNINALYIVNHQRFLPPMNRKNPPFNEVQITDAINDDRGLLTTWDLYKSYGYIQKGILDKLDIKEQIFQVGLITFLPITKYKKLGVPSEIHRGGTVFIFKLSDEKITLGQHILVQTIDDFFFVIVKEIMFNNQNVEYAHNNEYGFLIDKAIKLTNEIWIAR